MKNYKEILVPAPVCTLASCDHCGVSDSCDMGAAYTLQKHYLPIDELGSGVVPAKVTGLTVDNNAPKVGEKVVVSLTLDKALEDGQSMPYLNYSHNLICTKPLEITGTSGTAEFLCKLANGKSNVIAVDGNYPETVSVDIPVINKPATASLISISPLSVPSLGEVNIHIAFDKPLPEDQDVTKDLVITAANFTVGPVEIPRERNTLSVVLTAPDTVGAETVKVDFGSESKSVEVEVYDPTPAVMTGISLTASTVAVGSEVTLKATMDKAMLPNTSPKVSVDDASAVTIGESTVASDKASIEYVLTGAAAKAEVTVTVEYNGVTMEEKLAVTE